MKHLERARTVATLIVMTVQIIYVLKILGGTIVDILISLAIAGILVSLALFRPSKTGKEKKVVHQSRPSKTKRRKK